MSTIIITEKTNQANDVREAIGSTFGEILAAQGHLLVLQEPEEVNPKWDWKNWNFEVLRPENGFYKTKKDRKASATVKSKLSRIEEGLKRAEQVIIATDCDREGEGIGRELTEHFKYKGKLLRAVFTANDKKTLQKAFENLEPASKFENLYQAFRARQQADQIFNLTLTRAATKSVKPEGIEGALGIGRVKTPTLGILCRRELEIENFTPVDYYHVKALASFPGGSFEVRHEPEKYGEKEKLTNKEQAERIRLDAEGVSGPVAVSHESKKRGPPSLPNLTQIQKVFGSRKGWTGEYTLEVAQAVYDDFKIITYPRSPAKHLTEEHKNEVEPLLKGLAALNDLKDKIPSAPRKDRKSVFSDKALEGMAHYAIIPNIQTIEELAAIYPRMNEDQKALFDYIANLFIAAVSGDWEYNQTNVAMDVNGVEFKATGNVTTSEGWKAVLSNEDEKESEGKTALAELPEIEDGQLVNLQEIALDVKTTKAPGRYNEGTLIAAMEAAYKFVEDEQLRETLKRTEGIGTEATKGKVLAGLREQRQIEQAGKFIVPTAAGMETYKILAEHAPEIVDPGYTAQWELMLDEIVQGKRSFDDVVTQISSEAERLMKILLSKRAEGFGERTEPTEKMIYAARKRAERAGLDLPENYETDFRVCKTFLDENLTQGPYPPSDKQIALIEKMMKEKEEQPADGWREDSKIASAYLDKIFSGVKRRGKGRKPRKRGRR